MRIPILTTTVPLLVVGGMILFLGCGAESKNAAQGGNGGVVEGAAGAGTPSAATPTVTSAEPVPAIPTAPPTLSPGVDEIVQLAQSGVGDDVLQAYIENSPTAYQLEVNEILYLHDLGLSAEAIAAMVRHGQSLQGKSMAAATANTENPGTNNSVLPSVHQSQERSAVTAQDSVPASVPPAPENSTAPAEAYAITPPPQVNYNYFYQTLAPYGSWVEVPEYGWCWQPTVAVVDTSWRPYCNRGRWLWTDCGWYWQSDYSWGWAPFHYGRWYRSSRHGWVWAPDTSWGPAWVTWRYSDTYCGWAPLPPGAYFDAGVGFRFGGGHVGVSFDFGLSSDCYSFIPTAYFCDRTPWYYCLPRAHAVNVFNHTTIINNYIVASHNRTVVNVGPGTNAIATVARREIRKVTLRDSNPAGAALIKADRLERDGKTLAVFRPSLPQQAAAPPPEITRRQQELRKRSEFLAKSEVVKRAVASERIPSTGPTTRDSHESVSPSRGTPLTTQRANGPVPGNYSAGGEISHPVASSQPHQAVEPLRVPAISRNPRSERRNADVSPSSPVIVKQFPAESAPQSLAEVSPRTVEPHAPARDERATIYSTLQNDQSPARGQLNYRQPTTPQNRSQFGYQPPANPQVITPPDYRQEFRKPETVPAYNPSAPAVVAPRAAPPNFNPQPYYPPQSFSPPPAAAPRAIEPSAARPSSPPPSHSPPPTVSQPQPAPSAAPSQSRNEGGRKH